MLKKSLVIVLSLITALAVGQKRVPSKMDFAGMKLRIMDDAREEIQKDVDALTASPKYFEIKAERARTYFPIIERIFREENIPDDFKYLVLQESALISDAVSTSNAVGFWQFKDFTAVENGMRVDREIDERKNIVSATKGAASYLHKNNQFFDNWLHALQSYQMGAGGAMKALDKGHEGARTMVVNKKTYWYVKKYLAHKIAFEGSTDQKGQIAVKEYYDGNGKTLREIAKITGADQDELERYNKWASKGRVPDDGKKYAVIIPVAEGVEVPATTPVVASTTTKPLQTKVVEYTFAKEEEFPRIKNRSAAEAGQIVQINGLPGIIAVAGDRIPELAKRGDVALSKFLKYNDLSIDGKLIPGQVYYLKKKRNKAQAYYHVVQYGETLWSIAQKFGIKLKKLKTKNRITGFDEKLKPGRVMWLRYIRPSDVAVEYKDVAVPVVEETVVVQDTVQRPVPAVSQESDTPANEGDNVEETLAEEDVEADMAVDVREPDDSVKYDSELDDNPELDETDEPEDAADDVAGDETSDKEQGEDVDDYDVSLSQKSRKIHTVEIGQTFYAISKLYEVPVLDLAAWNGLSISTPLSVGQKLVVYVDEKVQDLPDPESVANKSGVIHTVEQGETMYQISNRYGVSVQEIMRWNNKENDKISYGEELRIEQIRK